MRVTIGVAVVMVSALATPARAWWGYGHETIAQGVLQDLGGTGDLERFFGEVNDQYTKIPHIEPASAHYINIDDATWTWGNAGSVSYATDFAAFRAGTFTFPTTLAAADARYGSGYVSGEGGVPWTAAATLSTLTDGMRSAVTYDDWYRLLQTAGALTHYIEDMHQPMHLTKDYDGIPSSGLHAKYEGGQFEDGSVRRYPELLAAITPVAPTYYGPAAGNGFITAVFDRIPTDYDKNVAIRDANAVARAAGIGAVYYDSLWEQTKAFTKESFQDAAAMTASALYTAYVNAGSPAIPEATFYATPAAEQSTIAANGPFADYTNEDFFRVRAGTMGAYGVARFDMAAIKARYDARYGAGLWAVSNVALATEVNSVNAGALAVYYSGDDGTNIQAGSVLRAGDNGGPLGVDFATDTPVLRYATVGVANYTVTRFDANTGDALHWETFQGDIVGGGWVTLVFAAGTESTLASYYGGAGLSLEVYAHLLGDANEDGRVDADDYALIDRGLARGMAGWGNGDFNGDGVVDAGDYFLIDRTFVVRGGAADPGFLASREAEFGADYVAALMASVPEPGVAGGLALILGVGRRRRSS